MESHLVLDDFLPYRISVLAAGMSQKLARIYGGRFGISIPEWRVLAHLSQAPRISVRDIHARVDMDKSKVSRAVMRLESAGNVDKQIDPIDRRLVVLSLTAKGKKLFSEIAALALVFEQEALSCLSLSDLATFKFAVSQLTAKLDK